jgi:hypothetical protein
MLLELFLDESSGTLVWDKIVALGIRAEQRPIVREIINGVLTDAFYTLLLGLDGEASLGGVQQAYEIRDEAGKRIADSGELGAEAFEQFHGD